MRGGGGGHRVCVILLDRMAGDLTAGRTVEWRRRRVDPAGRHSASHATVPCRARHLGRVYHGEVDSQHTGKLQVTA
jgi:hypothetical protein